MKKNGHLYKKNKEVSERKTWLAIHSIFYLFACTSAPTAYVAVDRRHSIKPLFHTTCIKYDCGSG